MRSADPRNYATGVTLIELMIAMAVIAILSAIAMPSYQQHVIRGKRSAAQSAMLDIANREQQFLLANRRYANTAALNYSLPSEVAQDYVLVVDAPAGNPPLFTITLTPIAGRGQASDGALTLNSQGQKTPLEKWKR